MSKLPNGLYAECATCAHVWLVVYLPMPLARAAEIAQRAACQKCGEIETTKITVASPAGMERLAEALRRGTGGPNLPPNPGA